MIKIIIPATENNDDLILAELKKINIRLEKIEKYLQPDKDEVEVEVDYFNRR